MKRKLSIVVAVFCMVVLGLIVSGYFMKVAQNEETTNEPVEEMSSEPQHGDSSPESEGSSPEK